MIRASARVAIDIVRLRRRLPRDVDRLGLDALVASLAARPRRRPLPRVILGAAIRGGEIVANRLYPDASTCLYRALARFAVLRAHGVAATFALGVRTDAPKDGTGHAWVEDEDGPWGEEIDDGEYVVTFSFPTPAE